MNKRKIIIFLMVFVLGIMIIISIKYLSFQFNNSKPNKNEPEKVLKKEEIEINGIEEISIIKSEVVQTNKTYNIYLTIKNISGHELEKSNLKILIKDQDNNIIEETFIQDVEKLEIDEERGIQISTVKDISKDKNYKYFLERVQ